jgi:two-component system, LytTR family, response regulator
MNKNIDVIIVDDEPAQREQLSKRIVSHFPQLNIAAVCSDAQEAMIAIARFSPDLVFLDVEMPGMSGFQMLESIKEIRFSVIFTTSHADYAVQAFRVAAIDFLLKPYHDEDFQIAVNRFLNQHHKPEANHLQQLLSNLSQADKNNRKIALPTSNGFVFIRIGDIVRLESQNTYTTFFMSDKNQFVVSRTLKDCEEILAPEGLLRVHQSHMVNPDHIKKYFKGEGGTIEMLDGSMVEVSRRKKEEFLEALKRL